MTVTITDAEAKILDEYLFRKTCKLKEAGLEDSDCYKALYSVRHKLRINIQPILQKYFRLETDLLPNEPVPNDNVAHFWLIYKNWNCIGTMTVLNKDEYIRLSSTLESTYAGGKQ